MDGDLATLVVIAFQQAINTLAQGLATFLPRLIVAVVAFLILWIVAVMLGRVVEQGRMPDRWPILPREGRARYPPVGGGRSGHAHGQISFETGQTRTARGHNEHRSAMWRLESEASSAPSR